MSVTASQRLPNRPSKPYIQPVPRKAKAMTIAASFECQEGFVLCADRLMTHGKHTDFGAFAHYEKKVFGFDDLDFAIAVCGSGDTITMRAVSDSILSKMELAKRPPISSALEESLNDAATKLGCAPELSLIVAAVSDTGESHYFRTDGLIVQPANLVEILGLGETSLIRYLIDSAYKPSMSIQELSCLAVFMVYEAKKYCPQYCGGQTDVCVLPRKSEWNPIRMLENKINEIENLFATKSPDQIKTLIKDAAILLK